MVRTLKRKYHGRKRKRGGAALGDQGTARPPQKSNERGRSCRLHRAFKEQDLQTNAPEAHPHGEQSPYPPEILRQGHHRCLAVGGTRPFRRDPGTQVQRAADEEPEVIRSSLV